MFIFYWLIVIMPLDEHPVLGRALVGALTPVKILGIVCLILAVYRMGLTGKYATCLRNPQAPWYLTLLLFQSASYFVQGGNLVSGAMAYSHVFSIATLFLVAPALIDTQPRLYRTLLVAVGAVGLCSLYAVRQQQHYGGAAGFRPSGMFNDSNEYALIASLWMPLAFVWAFSRRPLWERCLCFGCLGAAALGTTFAASRGGLLGMAAGFLLLIFRSHSRVRNLTLVGAAAMFLLVLFPNSALRRLEHPGYADQIGEEARLITWKAGLRMIGSHPLTGIGLQNFKPFVTQYENPGESVVTLAHNTYIEIAAELGIGAVVAFVGLLVASLYSLEISRRRCQTLRATHLANIALGLQAGVVSFAVSAIFISVWWEKMAWLLVFVSIAMYNLARARSVRHARRKRRVGPPELAVAGAQPDECF
jgi:O-antigen ligase